MCPKMLCNNYDFLYKPYNCTAKCLPTYYSVNNCTATMYCQTMYVCM